MDVDNVPLIVWQQLAGAAISARRKRQDVKRAVDDHFYNQIYSRWTQDHQDVQYKPIQPGHLDLGWDKVGAVWDAADKATNLREALGDKSRGQAWIQKEESDPSHSQSRLGESYSSGELNARFQFVVHMGGGQVLFNRMRRACQTYIKNTCRGRTSRSVVQAWKVFGEAQGIGRSDSCVVYLTKPHTNRRVTTLVNDYIWPATKDLVSDSFTPIGMSRVASKPLWAISLPSRSKWAALFGRETLDTHYGSAGGLMGLVLGQAFQGALLDSGGQDVDRLATDAKAIARKIAKKT